MDFNNVTAHALANIYFDGNVISHAITTADGEKKSFGVILPGSYHFGTECAERMEIIASSCSVTIDGEETSQTIAAGSHFDIAANSGFIIEVTETAQYICSYIN